MAWSEARRRPVLDSFGVEPRVPVAARLWRGRRRTMATGLVVVITAVAIGFAAVIWKAPPRDDAFSTTRSTTVAGVAPTPATQSAAATRGRQTVAARTGAITATVALDARVTGADERILKFQAPGRVTAVPVVVGQSVERGQLVAEIDSTALRQDLEAAQSRLDEATLRLKQSEAQSRVRQREETARLQTQLSQAQAGLRQAVADRARIAAGADATDIAQAESALATAQATAQRADADLMQLQAGTPAADLHAAGQQLTSAQAAQQQAEAEQSRLLAGADANALLAARQRVVQASVALQRAEADEARVKAGPDLLAVRAAEREYATAQATLMRAQADIERLSGPEPAALAAAERDVQRAEAALRAAKATKPTSDTRVAQDAAVTTAQLAHQDAIARRNQVRAGAPSWEIEVARRNLTIARSALDDAAARLEAARSGPDQLTIDAAVSAADMARLALNDAEAQEAALQAGASDADRAAVAGRVATASAAVTGAQAQYAMLAGGPTADQMNRAVTEAAAADLALQVAAQRLADLRAHPTEDELREAQARVDAATVDAERAQAEAAAPRREEDDPSSYDRQLLSRTVQQAQAQVDAIQRQVAATRLEAPVAGVIAQAKATVGDLIDPTTPAVIVAAPGDSVIGSEVAATEGESIAPGQAATVVVGDGAELKAEVASVANGSSPDTRIISLRVNWEGTPPTVGTPAHATVTTETRDQALLVPQKAVRTVGTRRFVDIADGSALKTTNVTTGLAADDMVEIVEGLTVGQLVVVGP